MNKKECKDPYTTLCLSRLTRILDLEMLEDLQEVEESGNVAKNLEIVSSSTCAHQSFLSKSSQKLNKLINKRSKFSMFWFIDCFIIGSYACFKIMCT